MFKNSQSGSKSWEEDDLEAGSGDVGGVQVEMLVVMMTVLCDDDEDGDMKGRGEVVGEGVRVVACRQ